MSPFCGFVWHENEEDMVAKLLHFLGSSYATTTILLAEQDKSRKNKDGSSKEGKKAVAVTGGESNEEDDYEESEKENGTAEIFEDEESEQSESEVKKDASGGDFEDKAATDTASTGRSKQETKKKTPMRKIVTATKPRSLPKGTTKSSSSRSKSSKGDDTSPKVFSRKKKIEEPKKDKSPVSKKSDTKEKSGQRSQKGEVKQKENLLKPSYDELWNAVCDILIDDDFNTVGCSHKKAKHLTKPELGHFRAQGVPLKRKLREFPVTEDALLPVGTLINVQHFAPGQHVDVTGTTKGKGFQISG